MKIQDVVKAFDEASDKNSKLNTIRILTIIRGGGLKEAKEMVDSFPFIGRRGKDIIQYIKVNDDWDKIKKIIKCLKYI